MGKRAITLYNFGVWIICYQILNADSTASLLTPPLRRPPANHIRCIFPCNILLFSFPAAPRKNDCFNSATNKTKSVNHCTWTMATVLSQGATKADRFSSRHESFTTMLYQWDQKLQRPSWKVPLTLFRGIGISPDACGCVHTLQRLWCSYSTTVVLHTVQRLCSAYSATVVLRQSSIVNAILLRSSALTFQTRWDPGP